MKKIDIKRILDEPFSQVDEDKVRKWNVALSLLKKDSPTMKDVLAVVGEDSLIPEIEDQRFYFCKLYNQIVIICKHNITVLFPEEYRGNILNRTDYLPLIAADDSNIRNLIKKSNFETIVLGDDLEWGNEQFPESETKNTTVDLGGNTLTTTQYGTNEFFGTYKIQNGTIKHTQKTTLYSAEENATLILDNCKGETNGTLILPYGDNATVILRKCDLKAFTFVVSTNATNKTIANIIVEDSIIEATDKDSTALIINIPGYLTIKNSKIIAGRQGVIVRGGKCNIINSEIICGGFEDNSKYITSNWKNGNEVPMAGIVVGNRLPGSYCYPACCEITNSTISLRGKATRAIYVYGDEYAAELRYDNLTTLNGTVECGGKLTYVNGRHIK